jgi:ABC-2 type transport system permease protein
MKMLSVFRKGLREQLREPWLLVLVVIMAPFFIFLMSLVYGSGSFSYRLAVIDHDHPVITIDGSDYHGSRELMQSLVALKNQGGKPALSVQRLPNRSAAEALLMSGKAHALLEIPAGFSRNIDAARRHLPVSPERLVYSGDMSSSSYLVTAVLAVNVVATYLENTTGQKGPVVFVEEPLGKSGGRSELDLAIPGMFVLAIIMLLFPVAMSLARESENGCLKRLQLTNLNTWELLGGVGLVQISVGVVAVLLAFATARAVGFQSQGPIGYAIIIGIIASFATIGVGLLVACFSRSVTEAFLIGNFPMMLLMFFSGSMIPIPKMPLFSWGSVTVGLWDWLPTTHAVAAMNKVLGLGLGLADIAYEATSLVVLSALYFFAGVQLFKRRRMAAV